MDGIPAGQSRHIQINIGNVLTIGILSLLWYGAASWGSHMLAKEDWPVISPLAVGAQNYLHSA